MWIPALLVAASLIAAPGASPPAVQDVAGDLVDDPADWGALLAPLMTAPETEEWQALESDAARWEFVREFWRRRDPTPGTSRNEVREIYLRRARRAAEMFAEADVAGYATDRGQVLLAFGLPDEIVARSPDGGPAPEIVWTYSSAPVAGSITFVRQGERYLAETMPTAGNEKFVASARQELRVLLSEELGGGLGESGTTRTVPRLPELPGEDPAAPAEAADEKLAPEVAPEVRAWMDLVFGGVSRDEIGMASDLAFFPARDGTYTTLAFRLDRDDLLYVTARELADMIEEANEAIAAARAAAEASEEAGEEGAEGTADGSESAAGGGTAESSTGDPAAAATDELRAADAQAVGEGEEDGEAEEEEEDEEEPKVNLKVFGAFLQGEPGEEDTVHQFIVPAKVEEDKGSMTHTPVLSLGVTLAPGRYRLAWGVMDEVTEKVVTRDETVTVPDFDAPGLRISEPLLAKPPHGEISEAMSTQKVYEGVRVGNLLIQDQLDHVFARDGIVEVVATVVGWEPNPAEPGKPLLEVEYRILEGDADRSLVRIPVQSLDFHVLGQQIPLGQVRSLEAGNEYRILMRVKDLVSGAETFRTVPIQVVEETPPPFEPVEEEGEDPDTAAG